MATDGKIYITISDERVKSSGKGTTTNDDKKENKDKDSEAKQFTKHQFQHFIVSETKQMVNYTLGNIGNFIGDYTMQRSVNAALSAVGKIKNIAMATAAYGVAGLVVSVGSMAVTETLGTISDINDNKRKNIEIQKLRNISGLNNLTNGSR